MIVLSKTPESKSQSLCSRKFSGALQPTIVETHAGVMMVHLTLKILLVSNEEPKPTSAVVQPAHD